MGISAEICKKKIRIFFSYLEETLDNLIDPPLAIYNCQYSDKAKSAS